MYSCRRRPNASAPSRCAPPATRSGRPSRPGPDPRRQPAPPDRSGTIIRKSQRSVASERLVAAASTAFSLLGALLASVGLFGVAAATVAQRTPELGIRMALGAGRWAVIREALGETLQVFAAGLGRASSSRRSPCAWPRAGRRSPLRGHRDGHGDGGGCGAGDAAGRGGGVSAAGASRGLNRSPHGHPRSVVTCMAPVVPDPKKIRRSGPRRRSRRGPRNHERETEIWLRIYKKGPASRRSPRARRSTWRCAGAGSTASARHSTRNRSSSATRRGEPGACGARSTASTSRGSPPRVA